MEKKRMSELTQEEKVVLLNHWLMYYGKVPVTLDVLEKIHHMIEEDTDKIMNIAMLNFVISEGSTPLINAVRVGKFEELSEMATALKEDALADPDKKELFEKAEDEFLEEIIGTYNNPEPDIPMGLDQILGAILGIDFTVESDTQANAQAAEDFGKRVDEVFFGSLFREDELADKAPMVPYVLAEGIVANFVFNAERLNANKGEIVALLDELIPDDREHNFTELCLTRDGTQWTGLHADMEKIVSLGIATGVLSYTAPREVWSETMGVPNVIFDRSKALEEVSGRDPKEFSEDTKKLVKRDKKESE